LVRINMQTPCQRQEFRVDGYIVDIYGIFLGEEGAAEADGLKSALCAARMAGNSDKERSSAVEPLAEQHGWFTI
jgi:hypothetical protein